MKRKYVGLASINVGFETEPFMAASGVAECVINPVTVKVNEFYEGETKDVTIGDINFD